MGIKHTQRFTSRTSRVNNILHTCLVAIGIGLIAMMLGCISLYIFAIYVPQMQAQTLWQTNKSRWKVNGSSNYTLIVARGGGLAGTGQETVDVQNGMVIGQSEPQCVGIDHCYLSSVFVTKLTVEDLFHEAENCTGLLLSCSVEYDPIYGYPKSIRHLCFDCAVAWTQVVNLYLNP